jgi:hypothetical protein
MDRGFSSPTIFHHLKAVGTVIPNRKELLKQAFAAKLKAKYRTAQK